MSITIDDNDVRITYAGGKWEALKVSNSNYLSTVHSTWDYDATASITFIGTQISIIATISIGAGKRVTTFLALDSPNGVTKWFDGTANTQHNVEMYNSGPLSAGSHTLVIKNRGEDNDLDFRLDRIVIQTADTSATASGARLATTSAAESGSSSISSSSSSPTGTNVDFSPLMTSVGSSSTTDTAPITFITLTTTMSDGSISTIISTASDAAIATSRSNSSTSTSHSASLAAIMGGAIGVLAAVVVGFILYFVCKKRRKRTKGGWKDPEKWDILRSRDVATPFSGSPDQSRMHSPVPHPLPQAMTHESQYPLPGYTFDGYGRRTIVDPPPPPNPEFTHNYVSEKSRYHTPNASWSRAPGTAAGFGTNITTGTGITDISALSPGSVLDIGTGRWGVSRAPSVASPTTTVSSATIANGGFSGLRVGAGGDDGERHDDSNRSVNGAESTLLTMTGISIHVNPNRSVGRGSLEEDICDLKSEHGYGYSRRISEPPPLYRPPSPVT